MISVKTLVLSTREKFGDIQSISLCDLLQSRVQHPPLWRVGWWGRWYKCHSSQICVSFCFSRPSPAFQDTWMWHFGSCPPRCWVLGYSLLLWAHSPALLCSAFPSWGSVPKSPNPSGALTWLLSLPRAWLGTWGMEVALGGDILTPLFVLLPCPCPSPLQRSHILQAFSVITSWRFFWAVGKKVQQHWDGLRVFQLKPALFGGNCSAEWHWGVASSPRIYFVLCWS